MAIGLRPECRSAQPRSTAGTGGSGRVTTQQQHEGAADDEGVLDPQVAEWLDANPTVSLRIEDLPAEMLALARGPGGAPPTRAVARVTDHVIDGVPIRIYQHDDAPTGLVVYFHGGGFCIGSIGLMDNVARELAHCARATVVSVEYRLAPEHPYPAGLDDCEAVTRWTLANAASLGASPDRVAVAGESAGGNLAAAVALRLRSNADALLAGQVLIYPSLDTSACTHRSREQFAGIVVARSTTDWFWESYSAGRDLAGDPCAAPVRAESLAGLPPAIVVLGGCDPLRDEGRLYARRLQEDGVAVVECCYPGQPHGFVNFGLPAAEEAFRQIGRWLRSVFAS
jgi:acetyl esterase